MFFLLKNFTMKCVVLITINILLISCKNDRNNDNLQADKIESDKVIIFSADVNPAYTIRLEKDLLFTETQEVNFNYISDVAVDDSGRVLITEMSMGNRAIHQFNTDGNYIGQLGREGMGPGEYQTPVHLQVVGDRAYIYDNLLNRITAYSLSDLNYVRSVPVLDGKYPDSNKISGMTPQSLFVLDNEEFVVGFGSLSPHVEVNMIKYFLADSQGQFMLDELFKLQAKGVFSVNKDVLSIQAQLPFDHDSFVYHRQNNFYTVWSEQFLIKVYDESGNLVRGIHYPVEKVPFIRNEYVENNMSSNLRRAVQYIDFPKYWPIVADLLVDDQGRLWVAIYTDDFNKYEWWVLENSGKLMARFEWPRRKKIQDIKNGFLYTRQTDEENGLQEVVRYWVEFQEM